MRILQLIDSLDAGGAEKMAVNYANALQEQISFSALCTTRKEGRLKELLLDDVGYFFLNKRNALDLKALFRLRLYVKNNKIEFIHAHSSSFFTAVLLKLVYPKIKIIWHDHFGARHLQPKNKQLSLQLASLFFYKVLTVNFENEQWLKKVLFTSQIYYIPNFITSKNDDIGFTKLKGAYGKRIIFLANLKNPKNHLQLLKAFSESIAVSKGWSLHLVGNDYQDDYSNSIKTFIEKSRLQEDVFLYGSCLDTFAILNQATIGVLCSTYEGFPVTLLEYGLAKLAVVSTNVGFCSQIIRDQENGFLFSPHDKEQVISALDLLIYNNENIISTFGVNLNKEVLEKYSDRKVVNLYVELLQN